MLRKLSFILLIVAVLCVLGCSAHTHNVGHGPAFDRTTTQRQWYLLYGIVPINEIDTQAMAAGRSNYEITTQITLIDFIYQAVLSPMTVTCRTVSVTR